MANVFFSRCSVLAADGRCTTAEVSTTSEARPDPTLLRLLEKQQAITGPSRPRPLSAAEPSTAYADAINRASTAFSLSQSARQKILAALCQCCSRPIRPSRSGPDTSPDAA
jgi:hypothetical protein